MSEDVRNEYFPDAVTAPGDSLRELLQERSMTQSDLAARMGRPAKTICEIVNGKAAITPETALELELVLGTPASFWIQREQHYREYLARVAQDRSLAQQVDWARKHPYGALQRLGYVPAARSALDRLRRLLEFYAIASPDQLAGCTRDLRVAFRVSEAFVPETYALLAWLRAGEHEVQRIDCVPYDQSRFVEVLREARALTLSAPNVFRSQLTQTCAAAGVAVVIVPELPGSRASGATRWLGHNRPVIQLSTRYKTDDHLWFTFFHEAAHILLHGRRRVFIEDNGDDGADEAEANRWAADFLIPPERYTQVSRLRPYSKEAIRRFAAQTGIAPGIVVGRLQHQGLLPHSHCNELKQRLTWAPETGTEFGSDRGM